MLQTLLLLSIDAEADDSLYVGQEESRALANTNNTSHHTSAAPPSMNCNKFDLFNMLILLREKETRNLKLLQGGACSSQANKMIYYAVSRKIG